MDGGLRRAAREIWIVSLGSFALPSGKDGDGGISTIRGLKLTLGVHRYCTNHDPGRRGGGRIETKTSRRVGIGSCLSNSSY